MAKRLKKSSVGVAHHTPLRTRLRIPGAHKKSKLSSVKKELEKIHGVKSVDINERTGSITLHHAPGLSIFEAIEETLETHANEMLELMVEEGPELGEIGLIAGGAALAGSLAKGLWTSVAQDRDLRKLKLTDLKQMVPAAFLAAGVYKLWKTESLWAGITPIALFYWAFDSYWKLNAELGHKDSHNGHDLITTNS